jgi:hypothetical protein
MAKKRKEPWKVRIDGYTPILWLGEDPVFLAGGFALPRGFTAHGEHPSDGTRADVEIEIGDGPRAVARRVSVSTGRPGGVLWNTMSKVPVRDLVATACLMVLHRGRPTPDGKTGWMPIGPDDADVADELLQIVRDLVGYVPADEAPENFREKIKKLEVPA